MAPDFYSQSLTELEQLKQNGLIEPTNSPWACEAFYVNKRAEQVRNKLRLVINYQPLNCFLADSKFPLPQRADMFQHLTEARIFSKFDLKLGFRQLGIHPEDRPKTAFSIPNHHFQWIVLPFGLKTAPSLFQQAMIRIFQPILSNTLIYINDILLFSSTPQDHHQLLSRFADIIQSHGIMLSPPKWNLANHKLIL